MHLVVCIKQVPDTTQVSINPETGTIIRAGIPAVINPYDLYAIEAALELKEKYGFKVTALSMGPPQAEKSLKEAVSYGCDNAVLLTDRSFGGSDTLATSLIISEGIKKIDKDFEAVDLVLCGKQTIDGDTAQVGPGLARRLDFLQLTYVLKIDGINANSKEIKVTRHVENGYQTIKGKMPAVLTILNEFPELRRASLSQLIKSAKYDPLIWTNDVLKLDKSVIGLKGSPTMVKKIFPPPPRKHGDKLENLSPEKAAITITKALIERKIVK
jgi:electron transfer flavoprotein beta subunit